MNELILKICERVDELTKQHHTLTDINEKWENNGKREGLLEAIEIIKKYGQDNL